MNLLDLPTSLLVQIWLLLALDGRIHLALTQVCTELRALWPTVGRHLYESPKIPFFLQSMTAAISRPFPATLRDQILNLRFKGALTGSGNVTECKLNPDRQLAATYHKDNTLRIHHVDTGACIRTWKCPFDVSCPMAWSPRRSRFIAIGGHNGFVAVFDIHHDDQCVKKHGDHKIVKVEWTEDEKDVLSIDSTGGFYACKFQWFPILKFKKLTGLEASGDDDDGPFTNDYEHRIVDVVYNPQPMAGHFRQTMVTIHKSGRTDYVHLWRYGGHENEGVQRRLDNGTRIYDVVFSKCGETIAMLSDAAYLWKSPGKVGGIFQRDPTFILKHPDEEIVKHVVFVDDRRVVTTGDFGTVTIWDYHTGKLLHREDGAHWHEDCINEGISDVCVDDNGNVLVVSRTLYGEIRAWNPETGEVVKECRWEHEALLASFCQDGVLTSAVAVGGGNRVLCITCTKDAIVM